MSDDVIIITEEDMDNAAEEVNVSISSGVQKIQWDPLKPNAVSKEAADIVLLIDTSGSMGATDYSPNRLAAAKEAARLFTRRKITQNYNDRVGVIGFGGSPTVVHPLDNNLDKVAAAIDRVNMTHSGTYIGPALKAALQSLSGSKTRRRAIVLLSDGADEYDSSKPVEVARALKGIKVFTIGMGTVKGGIAKLPHGKQQVFLNEKILKQIAKVTGGEYLYAPDVPELQRIYTKLADY